jgi:hypothetical protein
MKTAALRPGLPAKLRQKSILTSVPALRHSPWDVLLVALALGHGVVLLLFPPAWCIALGLWWNANTVSHNFIHRPFFRGRRLNPLFSAYLSVLLGFPQSLWRERHLAHHRGESVRWRTHWKTWVGEGLLLGCCWTLLLFTKPGYFLQTYLLGWLAGLVLCQLQGYFEHGRGLVTFSHYGRVYNWLFFNDGFHVEHHAHPGRHWTELPRCKAAANPLQQSRWPAILRWLDWFNLNGLERLVLHSTFLQRFVLRRHEAAFKRLVPLQTLLPVLQKITVVGGGLFPRTALVLRSLAPQARLHIIDGCAAHVAQAKPWLDETVEYTCEWYEPALVATNQTERETSAELLIIPLAYRGDKSILYRRPPARHVLVHDWLWRKRGRSVIISVLLLKRLNLVSTTEP